MPAEPIRNVKVWINAFIPRNVPGVTVAAPGASAGSTMVRGPLNTCFLTDNRDFDTNIHAPSRMHSELTVEIAGPRKGLEWHNCDETKRIHPTTGRVIARRQAASSRMRFSNLRGSASDPGGIKVDVKGAAVNPLMPSPVHDVDFVGLITINPLARTIRFDGKVDEFPAFEMYASVNNTRAFPLFRVLPHPGSPGWNLPGSANRPVNSTITIPNQLP